MNNIIGYAKKSLPLGVALATMVLASMPSGADPRSDGAVPYSSLAVESQSEGDTGTRVWSEANALQAVAYMAGYAFTYEQVKNFGCPTVDKPDQTFGDFTHIPILLNAEVSRELNVITPNNDTLYSTAALALDGEPAVFTAPASLNVGDRYWSMMLQDAASNVPYVLGSASTGTGDFVIAWKGWQGKLPKNLPVFMMDTPFIWPLVRTGVNGPEDVPAVNAIQSEYAFTPLSEYCASRSGRNQCKFSPGPQRIAVLPSKAQDVCDRYPPGMDSTPTGVANNPLEFWDGVNVFTSLNPPPAYETSTLQMYKDILVGPGQQEDLAENAADYDPIIIDALTEATKFAPLLTAQVPPLSESQNGWDVLKLLADYGDLETGVPYDYLLRGAVNMYGPGGLPASEALYYNGFTDGDGVPYSGANTYTQTFVVPPPVGAFWSLTMYGNDGFFYDNVDNKYSVGSSTINQEPDGSFVLTISHVPPAGGDLANWLPAPEDGFYVVLRTYVPLEPETYFPPPLVRE